MRKHWHYEHRTKHLDSTYLLKDPVEHLPGFYLPSLSAPLFQSLEEPWTPLQPGWSTPVADSTGGECGRHAPENWQGYQARCLEDS